MIRTVSYAEILGASNSPELMEEYAHECSNFGKPSPRGDLYDLLEKSGGFQAFGVFDGDMLIGFACVLIYTLPHFDIKIATSESIFLQEKYRSSGLGDELMDLIESYARELKCKEFIYSALVGSRFDKLLIHRARHCSNVYARKL